MTFAVNLFLFAKLCYDYVMSILQNIFAITLQVFCDCVGKTI